MEFLTDNAYFTGYEEKTFKKDGSERSWLVCRFAAGGTGQQLEINANMDMIDMIKAVPQFARVTMVVALAPKKDGGLSMSLRSVLAKGGK